MTTALDIITGSAKLLGVIAVGEAMTNDEAQDGLTTLNDMLDSWSSDLGVVYANTLESFNLTGAASYTIGVGGNFNTSRPTYIKTAVVRIASVDYPLQIITEEQYQNEIAIKSITTQIPQFLVYAVDYPLSTIYMYPIPSGGSTLRMLSFKPITNLSALTTTVTFPPGWNKALKYNLAVDMAPQYGVSVTPEVLQGAKQSKGAIQRAVSVNNKMPLTDSLVTRYSIYNGTE
jgi:hypothetical protein